MTKENGKKIAEGLFEGGSPSPTLRHNAGMALTNTGIAAEVAPGQWYTHLCGSPPGWSGSSFLGTLRLRC